MKWVYNPLFCFVGVYQMENIEYKIRNLIEPICIGDAVFLYDVSIQGAGNNQIVKIIVDTESGITLDQCKELSKKISDLFFRKELFVNDYRLEVSSPGVNKPLQQPYEYRRSIGKNLKVIYKQDNEQKTAIGKLIAFNDNIITLEENKGRIAIAIDDIEKAKIQLKW